MEMLLGMFAAYVWAHFIVMQFTKKWGERNTWEQIVSVLAIMFFILFILGSM